MFYRYELPILLTVLALALVVVLVDVVVLFGS